MRRLFNEMLFSNYCHYRKKEDLFIASFHVKGMLAVGLFFYVFSLYIILKIMNVIHFRLNLPSSKLFIGIVRLLPCEIILCLITKSKKQLELQYQQEGSDYTKQGRTFYNAFFFGGLVLFVLLAIINDGN
jgi:hypothetical protein